MSEKAARRPAKRKESNGEDLNKVVREDMNYKLTWATEMQRTGGSCNDGSREISF